MSCKHLMLVLVSSIVCAGGCSSTSKQGDDGAAPPADAGQQDSRVDKTEAVDVAPDAAVDPCGGCRAGLICDETAATCVKSAQVMVPMRDDVKLLTHVFLPEDADQPVPTVLLRTPYVRQKAMTIEVFSELTKHGYAFVLQGCRGVDGSEGTLAPMKQEFADGQDAVRWIAAQPWSDAKVGTIGASYEGFTALAAAVDTPEVKVVIADGHQIDAYTSWPMTRKGVVFWHLLWWTHSVLTGEDLFNDMPTLTKATNHRPVREQDQAILGKTDELWQLACDHIDANDDYWKAWSLTDKLHRICAPILSLQAEQEWDDDPLRGHLEAARHGCPAARDHHRFVLGNHPHGNAVYSPLANNSVGTLIRDYLRKFLKGEAVDLSAVPKIQFHIEDGDWRGAPSWPVHSAEKTLYLAGGITTSALVDQVPGQPGALQYVFDPQKEDACSMVKNQPLIYAEAKLAEGIDVAGMVKAHLWIEIDTPDADLFVDILHFAPTATEPTYPSAGGSIRLRYRDGFENPQPVTPNEPLEIVIEATAGSYHIPAGHSLGIVIHSSTCGYAENPNTGDPIADAQKTQPVKVKVLTGPDHPSRIILPISNK